VYVKTHWGHAFMFKTDKNSSRKQAGFDFCFYSSGYPKAITRFEFSRLDILMVCSFDCTFRVHQSSGSSEAWSLPDYLQMTDEVVAHP
jgi:hypothetical protein